MQHAPRLLEHDPLTGVKEWFVWDDGKKGFTIVTETPLDDILSANREAKNTMRPNANWRGNWHRVASVPMGLYAQLRQQGRLQDDAECRRFLNATENDIFRTRPGRV